MRQALCRKDPGRRVAQSATANCLAPVSWRLKRPRYLGPRFRFSHAALGSAAAASWLCAVAHTATVSFMANLCRRVPNLVTAYASATLTTRPKPHRAWKITAPAKSSPTYICRFYLGSSDVTPGGRSGGWALTPSVWLRLRSANRLDCNLVGLCDWQIATNDFRCYFRCVHLCVTAPKLLHVPITCRG